MAEKAIRILIADDHAVVRNGFRRILEAQWDLEVLGEVSNGREAVEAVLEQQPDVVLMDVTMPELNGIEATRRIVRDAPKVRVLALSMHKDAVYVREILRANPPRLFICGHSHILKVMPDRTLGLLHINPGAAGREGFHKVRTIIRFSLEAGNISDLQVVELGMR